MTRPRTQTIQITTKPGVFDAACRQVGENFWRLAGICFVLVGVVHSGLTKKAEPPPTRGVNRVSGTDSANGGWLRRLVRRLLHILHKTIRQAIAEVLPMKHLRDIRKHMNMLLELTRWHQKQ